MYIVMNFDKFFESKNKFPNLKNFDIDGFLVLMGKDSQSIARLNL